MAERPAQTFSEEVRGTVVKSGLTGVAATILAVTVFSPAGLGGLIGTSLASGFGGDSNARSADDPYARLPAYPTPLTEAEISTIQAELAQTSASLEITKAATDARIEHVRTLALTDGMVTFSPAPQTYARTRNEDLRLGSVEPVRARAPVSAAVAAPVAPAAVVVVAAPVVERVSVTPVSYSAAADLTFVDDVNPELAELLLTHELY
jgi:hypothetical protein